jgi:hypothetical protein
VWRSSVGSPHEQRCDEERIPDPKTATKEEGKNIFCPTFFCCHKYHKMKNYFIFEQVKKKLRANLQRIIELFT